MVYFLLVIFRGLIMGGSAEHEHGDGFSFHLEMPKLLLAACVYFILEKKEYLSISVYYSLSIK